MLCVFGERQRHFEWLTLRMCQIRRVYDAVWTLLSIALWTLSRAFLERVNNSSELVAMLQFFQQYDIS